MKWDLYDALIDLVPPDLTVQELLAGLNWIAVHSEGIGLAMMPSEGRRTVEIAGSIRGMRVRDLAGYAKSWNNYEAACGLAAINSVVNSRPRVEAFLGGSLDAEPSITAFDFFKDRVVGKKVAVIGHFPGMESLAEVCHLSILERRPLAGDLPDPSCEYVLPDQDFIFITGSALINKTLPRLLELSRSAYTVVMGPTAPLTPILFDYGVDAIASSVVIDGPQLWQCVQEGGSLQIFQQGARMIQITASSA